jgi:putative flippase GtrA
MKLAITYAVLALIATITNIAAQDLVLRSYRGAPSLLISIFTGTLVGLVVKYLLDKHYIFRFRSRNALHDAQTFTLYALTGVGTTAVFWGFEFGFDAIFANTPMRYCGAVIGLTIGYVSKFQLDRRFVFGAQRG